MQPGSRWEVPGLVRAAGAVYLASATPPPVEHARGFLSANLEVSASDWIDLTRLVPENTGLRFENPLPARLAAANINLMDGSGMAAGDFNSDGPSDLPVNRGETATCRNENIGARPGLRLRLSGPPANPTSINTALRLGAREHCGAVRVTPRCAAVQVAPMPE